MKAILSVTCILSCLFFSPVAWSYEPPTHGNMSRAAVNESNIGKKPELLGSIGLINDQTFPDSRGQKRSIRELVAFGSIQEDDRASGTQAAYPPLRHFYDPITGLPIFVPGYEGESVPSPVERRCFVRSVK